MKISKIFLENFRGFYDLNTIEINDFAVLFGKNDKGKSTILEAIDILINEGKGTVKIEKDDLNVKAKSENIDEFRIGIEFENFPE
ncbi:AAA family ATPase [Stygiobacter electus]|uniref:AAA family ATPase n=1 Tax=Stygiobacter electus TaxID=3032292 RepID=A0AAE3NZF6_9BACT|nr:AAA family ATPase [Stygiobacter electus]MDF1612891.1 AAA family ATPase [Stygiobacter electus]